MTRSRKLTRNIFHNYQVNKIITKRDSRTPGCNQEGEIYHVSEIIDYELADVSILDEFTRNQELMSE